MTIRQTGGAAILALCGMLWGVPAIAQNSPAPDNTKVNKSDRAAGAPTADQAKNNKSDREIMKEIRKSIHDDKSLSSYAHNGKIIAQKPGRAEGPSAFRRGTQVRRVQGC